MVYRRTLVYVRTPLSIHILFRDFNDNVSERRWDRLELRLERSSDLNRIDVCVYEAPSAVLEYPHDFEVYMHSCLSFVLV